VVAYNNKNYYYYYYYYYYYSSSIIIIIIINLLIEERMFVWYNKFDIVLNIPFVCDKGNVFGSITMTNR
jgi:hypothetical protein